MAGPGILQRVPTDPADYPGYTVEFTKFLSLLYIPMTDPSYPIHMSMTKIEDRVYEASLTVPVDGVLVTLTGQGHVGIDCPASSAKCMAVVSLCKVLRDASIDWASVLASTASNKALDHLLVACNVTLEQVKAAPRMCKPYVPVRSTPKKVVPPLFSRLPHEKDNTQLLAYKTRFKGVLDLINLPMAAVASSTRIGFTVTVDPRSGQFNTYRGHFSMTVPVKGRLVRVTESAKSQQKDVAVARAVLYLVMRLSRSSIGWPSVLASCHAHHPCKDLAKAMHWLAVTQEALDQAEVFALAEE